MNQKTVNDNLIKFWDDAIKLPEDYKKQELERSDRDYHELAPSEKLFDAATLLGKYHKVLDYGCGGGWASIIAIKSGCKNVTAVDVGKNIIETLKFYAELYDATEGLNAFDISTNWLKSVKNATYDGLICSNVLDVVPLEVAVDIVKELARVTSEDAIIIIGLNFYLSSEQAKSRGMELVDNRYLFVNDVLRLSSLSDEEWKEVFNPYFEVDKLDYFAWPGEAKETRRLFFLKKK